MAATGTSVRELVEARFGLTPVEPQDRPATAVEAQLLSHRTHRQFKDRDVDPAVLERLFACALSAPSKSDLQQVAIVQVQDRDRRQAIAELIPDMPWIGSAPVFLVFCGDSRRIRRICELRGTSFANDHLDAFLNAAVDAALGMQALIAAAESNGLGCCPISVVRNHIETVAEILELPQWVFPVAGLCIGHPARDGYVSLRLPPAASVHTDRYDDARLAEEIDAYDRRRDAVYSIPAEKQRLPERFGRAEFYGWSEDKARQVSVRERDQLAGFLIRQGFNLG